MLDLATGPDHACVVSTGEVWCWGSGSSKALGNDSTSRKISPVQALGITDATAVTAGVRHTCAIVGTGQVMCWGYSGAVLGTSGADVGTPTAIPGLADAVAIEAEANNTCAIKADQSVVCWGEGLYGVNGDGTLDDTGTPVPVIGLTGVTALRGDDSMCASASDGLWCWGRNDNGEAGSLPFLTSPDPVVLPRAAVRAADPAVIIPAGPARFADTRPTGQTIDGAHQAEGRRASGSIHRVRIAGRGDVPTGADAVVVNLTAVQASGPGYATVYPCSAEVPTASSLNYTAGVNLGNEVIAQLDTDGDLCVFVFTGTHLTLDVTGYLPFSSPYEPVAPARLVDTRPGTFTIDGADIGAGPFQDGEVRAYSIAGRGGVRDQAAAVVLNVTAIRPTERSFVTMWPCSAERPTTSSLNVVPGVNRANELMVALDGEGDTCVFVRGSAHVAIDVVGQLGDVTSLRSFSPQRFVDTRSSGVTFDGRYAGPRALNDGETLKVQVAGRGNVPASATAVVVNLTVVNPTGVGYVTLYPCSEEAPLASSLNYVEGVNGANDVIAQLSSDGSLCAFVFAGTHVLFDVSGALSA